MRTIAFDRNSCPLIRTTFVPTILGALLLGAVGFAGWQGSALLAAMAERRQVDRATASVFAVARDVADLERGQHGFLLTGREPALAPYHRALRDIDSRIAMLRSQVAGDATATRVAVRIASQKYRLAVFVGRTIALRRHGSVESALALERQGTGWLLAESIQSDIEFLLDRLESREAPLAAAIDVHRDRLEWGLKAIVLLAVASTLRHLRVARVYDGSSRSRRAPRRGSPAGRAPAAAA